MEKKINGQTKAGQHVQDVRIQEKFKGVDVTPIFKIYQAKCESSSVLFPCREMKLDSSRKNDIIEAIAFENVAN